MTKLIKIIARFLTLTGIFGTSYETSIPDVETITHEIPIPQV